MSVDLDCTTLMVGSHLITLLLLEESEKVFTQHYE